MIYNNRVGALGRIMDFIGSVFWLVVVILWSAGGLIGVIISAIRNDLLGVILSILIPGYGAVITIIAFFRWIF